MSRLFRLTNQGCDSLSFHLGKEHAETRRELRFFPASAFLQQQKNNLSCKAVNSIALTRRRWCFCFKPATVA